MEYSQAHIFPHLPPNYWWTVRSFSAQGRHLVGFASLECAKDYGRPMKTFFNNITNFLANWANRPNKFWDYFRPNYQNPFWHCEWFSSFSCFFYKKKLLFIPNPCMKLTVNNFGNSHHVSVVCRMRDVIHANTLINLTENWLPTYFLVLKRSQSTKYLLR